jgi:hypothetical protein
MHNFRVQIIGRSHDETVVCISKKDEPDYAFNSTELQQRKERKLTDKVSNLGEKLLVHIIQITLLSPCTSLVRFQLAVNSDK